MCKRTEAIEGPHKCVLARAHEPTDAHHRYAGSVVRTAHPSVQCMHQTALRHARLTTQATVRPYVSYQSQPSTRCRASRPLLSSGADARLRDGTTAAASTRGLAPRAHVSVRATASLPASKTDNSSSDNLL